MDRWKLFWASCYILLGSLSLFSQETLATPVAPPVAPHGPLQETVRIPDFPDKADAPAVVAEEDIPAAMAPNPYRGDLRNRMRLTGDWGGRRSSLKEKGLVFDLFATQFYQGVAGGGRIRDFEYGGKLDYLFHGDAGALGLLPGFFLDIHAETRLGNSVNGIDGLIAPSNIVMMFPEPEGTVSSITGFKMTQALSESFAVYLGKINTLDEYPLKYSPGMGNNRPGLEGFMNTSLVFNPIAARTVPYSTAAVGAAILQEGEPLITLTVFDPDERAARGMDDLFARGMVLVPDMLLRTNLFGMPGKLNFGGTYSSAKYSSTDPASYLAIPPGEGPAPLETGSWCLYTNFYQSLWVDELDEKRTWGVFGQFGISDGNPNPISYVTNAGIGGRSPISWRKLDTFGVGFFYMGLSDQFKSLTSTRIPEQNEYGVELFYNYAITPWCRLTGDLQFAEPSTKGLATAILAGLRLQMLF